MVTRIEESSNTQPVEFDSELLTLNQLNNYLGKVVKYTSDFGQTWDYFLLENSNSDGVVALAEKKNWNDRWISAKILFTSDSFTQIAGTPQAYFETASYREFQSTSFSGVEGSGYLSEDFASKACPLTPPSPFGRFVSEAPLTLVRSEKPTELKVSVQFNKNFKPKNPLEPKPSSTLKQKLTWNIATQEDGTLKINDQRVHLIWWEAVRKEAVQPATSFQEKYYSVPVKRSELKPFLHAALQKLGVHESEREAFVEYWHHVFTKGHDPENAPYVIVQLVAPENLSQYVPEMSVDNPEFQLTRFYFTFEPAAQLPRENFTEEVLRQYPSKAIIHADSFLNSLKEEDLGKNTVIDLGGEVVDSPDVKVKGAAKDHSEFEKRFIKQYIYA